MSRPRILFHRGGALGDLVLTLPVLAALCAEGEVDVAVDPRWWPLLTPLSVHRRWDVGGVEALWMHGGQDPVGYDFAVAFSSVELPIRDVRRVAPRPPPGVSAAMHFASVVPCDPAWRLPVAPTRADRPIVVLPGSSNPDKVWPGFPAVAEALGALVVGGPNEPWAQLRPDLWALAGLLASADTVLASDSGPAHLASRVGARTGVVFGPTDAETWCPVGAQAFSWHDRCERLVAWVRNGR